MNREVPQWFLWLIGGLVSVIAAIAGVSLPVFMDMRDRLAGMEVHQQYLSGQLIKLDELQTEMTGLSTEVAEMRARGILPVADRRISTLEQSMGTLQDKLKVVPAEVLEEVRNLRSDLKKAGP